MQRRVTLSFDGAVYDNFQKACREQDVIVSKRIERLMMEETDLIKKNKREKK
jgi:hypothetical protein